MLQTLLYFLFQTCQTNITIFKQILLKIEKHQKHAKSIEKIIFIWYNVLNIYLGVLYDTSN